MMLLSLTFVELLLLPVLVCRLDIGRRRCRPLSLEIMFMRLDCNPYFGFGTILVSVTI